MCAKHFMTSKLPISKNNENISEQISRKYVILYTKIDIKIVRQKLNRTRSIGLSF